MKTASSVVTKHVKLVVWTVSDFVARLTSPLAHCCFRLCPALMRGWGLSRKYIFSARVLTHPYYWTVPMVFLFKRKEKNNQETSKNQKQLSAACLSSLVVTRTKKEKKMMSDQQHETLYLRAAKKQNWKSKHTSTNWKNYTEQRSTRTCTTPSY